MARVDRKMLKDTLDAWMTLKGLDQTALQNISSVPQPTINRILTGVTISPRGNTLVKIATAMDISIDQLMSMPNLTQDDLLAAPNKSSDLGLRQPTISDFLVLLSEKLLKADEPTRKSVGEMLLRYSEAPDPQSRIANAIAVLLDDSHDA